MEELELTLEEKQELETLRAEKAAAELQSFAAEYLKKYGIDGEFAPYLVGTGREDTAEKVQGFAKHLDRVTQKLRSNLTPAPNAEQPPQPSRRGIRIL